MDHHGAAFGGALLHYHGNQLKGAADGPVWVGPGGGAVALHLQLTVTLQEQEAQMDASLPVRLLAYLRGC